VLNVGLPCRKHWIRRHEYDGAVPLQIRKLSQDEAATAFPGRRQMDLSEYVQAIGNLQPGDGAAMDLGDLTARAAKRRMGQAATQLGRRLRWARTTVTDVVYFQVLANTRPRDQGLAGLSATGKPRRVPSRRARSTVMPGPHTSEKTAGAPEPKSSHASRGPRRKGAS